MRRQAGPWLRHLGFVAVGGVIGVIAALNLLIHGGAERGYETGLTDVVRDQPLLGIAVVSVLVLAPLVALYLSIRRRS